jgi:hypothetical protein
MQVLNIFGFYSAVGSDGLGPVGFDVFEVFHQTHVSVEVLFAVLICQLKFLLLKHVLQLQNSPYLPNAASFLSIGMWIDGLFVLSFLLFH